MNWLHQIFTTPESVISFINNSNLFFIVIIICVGIYSFHKYLKVIKEIGYYDYVIDRFNDVGAATNDIKEREKWKKVKDKIKSTTNEELRPALFLSKLNEVFAEDIAINLKKANSWFEGLSSLGLFGTVFGLLVGALYTSGDTADLSVMVSSFSTALITTFLGLFGQLLIRGTAKDVEAENKAEEFQGKMLQLEKLAIKKPEILSNTSLDREDEQNNK